MPRVAHVVAGAAILTAAVALALGWSGLIPAFGRNRGLLQVTVAMPVTCAAAGLYAARWTPLGARSLGLAVVPVIALAVALGVGFEVELAALPAAAALAAPAVVPWLGGVWLGDRWRRKRVD